MSNTLADVIHNGALVAGTTGTGRLCPFGTILTKLDDTDRDAVVDALHGKAWSDDRLATLLRRGGRPVSIATLSRHRRGLCVCGDGEVSE